MAKSHKLEFDQVGGVELTIVHDDPDATPFDAGWRIAEILIVRDDGEYVSGHEYEEGKMQFTSSGRT